MRTVSDPLDKKFESLPIDSQCDPLRHEVCARAGPQTYSFRCLDRFHPQEGIEWRSVFTVGQASDAQIDCWHHSKLCPVQSVFFGCARDQCGREGTLQTPCSVHVKEGTDVKSLGHIVSLRIEEKSDSFTPGSVRDFRDAVHQSAIQVVAIVNCNRILMVSGAFRVGEKKNWAICHGHLPSLICRQMVSLELSAAIQRNDIEVDMVIKVVYRLLFPPVADNPLQYSNFAFFHDDGALILLLLFIPWPLCRRHREEEPIYKLNDG
mmetsp:Transcript_21020/g.70080  ORF Transcript_21020/g.70080 Transcript_21020/m.70080 type:complete len:264 (-) Transcript_21020:249-1040(-)